MTALNKTLRQEIIDSVIKKGTTIPARKADLKKRTALRVRELDLSRLPAEFGPATKSLPPEWFPLNLSNQMNPKVCPDSYVELTDDQLRSQWKAVISYEPFRHPINARFGRNDYIDQGLDHNTKPPTKKPDDMESWEAVLADLLVEAKQIRADEEEARAELRRFLWSVNNYKQVLEKMPELEPHLPNYTKPMPLVVPVAPILKTLGKLGFDKSQEAAAPAKKSSAKAGA
jgi:hypothetical protein